MATQRTHTEMSILSEFRLVILGAKVHVFGKKARLRKVAQAYGCYSKRRKELLITILC